MCRANPGASVFGPKADVVAASQVDRLLPVCTENLIRVDDVKKSLKLAG
jgi:hypothetical protein